MIPPNKIIRKESSKGIGYSVVELGDTHHVFAAAVPRSGQSFSDQAKDALQTIERVMIEEGTRDSIVQQAIFLKHPEDVEVCREIMRDFYGDAMPATTYVLQPPCEEKLLSIEALGVGQRQGQLSIERLTERTVIVRHDGITFIHLSHIDAEQNTVGAYGQCVDVFGRLEDGLTARGFRYDQVIRTWLYLGKILGTDAGVPRYHELNRVRTDFYRQIHFGADLLPDGFGHRVYPASTGIGTDGNSVVMSCIALATDRTDIKLVPLENPLQTSAFDYGEDYGPDSPKFSRAIALIAGKYASIFISGTASLLQSDTRHTGDIESQTRQTLANIAALISPENFRRHGMLGYGASLGDLAYVRVYIKHQEHYSLVKGICESQLGDLPTVYARADVCREDLLVEIEGIAFSRRSQV